MAKIYLDENENYGGTIGSDSIVTGSTGTEQVTFAAGATGVTIDSQVEKVVLAGNVADYTYQQQGNTLVVYSGTTVAATIGLQIADASGNVDANGTLVQFANGSVVSALFSTTTGAVTLGGGAVTAGTTAAAATAVIPTTFVTETPPAATFTLTDSTVAGLKTMVLSGDMDVRIDMTNTTSQITGLDLNGNGVIANNGIENASNVFPATGYKAVDAYTRLDNGVVNETDLTKVFLGDIKYDGSGFAGDGVSTNGNVVLGGLGADTILGGIGNDFLAGGGVALSREGGTDSLSGGRNADFFFTELSLLSNTDGNNLVLDGGTTADDNSAGNSYSAQNTDWLLLQASDDDEPVTVVLEDHLVDGNGNGNLDDEGVISTRAGQQATMRDVENVDASGNTYGFLKDVTTTIGGAPVNANNNGIGSSAQLNISTEDGSNAANRIIGGYDNDVINGGGGNDLLMGGNLRSYADDGVTVAHQILDPNLVGLTGNNDGRDVLVGGAGADNIVFEADGGVIEGGATQNQDDAEVDTLWLTENSLGAVVTAGTVTPVTATTLTTDNTLRFDLGAGKQGGIDNFSGYGGAGDTDSPSSNASGTATGFTADQTNYVSESTHRVQVQDMENVIATGLGALDYKAAGANSATDVTFQNQQNFQAYNGNLDLRGTDGDNTLYAAAGIDTIEGRAGNDLLSGGEGVDSFIFDLGAITGSAAGAGDGLDVIWRQADTDNNNLWDVNAAGTGDGAMARIGVSNQAGLMGADFGRGSDTIHGSSKLDVDFTATDLAAANKYLSEFTVKIGTETFTVTDLAALQAATNATEVAAVANAAFNAIDANVTVTANGNVLTVRDSTPTGGRSISDNLDDTAGTFLDEGLRITAVVSDPSETVTNPSVRYTAAGADTTQDRIIFAAYNNRADGELVDDGAMFGGDTLGTNNYAQDLVVGFNVDGSTVLAERQAFRVDLSNLAVEDKVTVTVNNVTYSLTVGRELDHTLIAGETTFAFAGRLATYINNYLDNDTAAGKVLASAASGAGNAAAFVLTQEEYANEETVFMNVSVNVRDNSSNGEGALGTVTNLSSTDITLYQYNGRDAKLNAADVLFVGDSGVGPDGTVYSENSRSILATADNLKHADGSTNLDAGGYLLGSDAIVVNVTPDVNVASSAAQGVGTITVNNHVETLVANGIYFNAVENPTTGVATNYAIHGDDQLIGGDAADTILAGTGDDRVYGSLGLDHIDGGKDLYLVDGQIQVLNDYDATVVDAIPATLDIHLLTDGAFDDTLVYQQSDFGVVGVGGSTFNIALDLSANQANGGAGRVITNGLAANTTLFTNMEHIRTVAGNGTLLGQGNDTLDLSITVNPLTGVTAANAANMRYFLTKEANAGGEVRMATTVAGNATGAGTLFTKVDGVENVKGGTGTDYLYIDQTESGKNNSFDAGTSTAGNNAAQTAANGDKIFYQNNAVALTAAQLPVVKLAIGAADVDTVTMTNGMLEAGDAPVDTLTGVEFIDVNAVARNADEADILDVSALTGGATVNFITGQISNAATLVATVTGTQQFELVSGSTGSDLVIVADNQAAGNASADATLEKILFDSYLTYDTMDDPTIAPAFDADALLDRMTVADLRSANTVNATNAIPNVTNTALFTYDLGAGAADRVDYSAENGTIAAVVNLTTGNADNLSVLVDANADGDIADATDRIDVLKGVEQIVAGSGTSIIDLTSFGQASKITFQYTAPAVPAGDDIVEAIVRIADSANNSIDGLANLVERFDNSAGGVNASWNRIEGSDYAETVTYDGSEDLVNESGLDHRFTNDTLTLRGGNNVVSYFNLETSIETTIGVVADTGAGDGVITADVKFYDGLTPAYLAGTGTHVITSNSATNSIVGGTGTLKIEASQDAEDTLVFAGLTEKLFILGTSPGVINVSLDATENLVLTGFERLQDAATNDVYDMINLGNVVGQLEFIDSVNDHDMLVLRGSNGVAFNGSGALTIDLDNLSATVGGLNMDFDVLDISNVTTSGLTVNGGTDAAPANADTDATDEVVLGALSLVNTIADFESMILTQGSVAAGTTFTFNTAANTLVQGSTTVSTTADILSFAGLVLEPAVDADTRVAHVTSALNVTVAGAASATVYGGDGADAITGGDAADMLLGGAGIDTINGGAGDDIITGGAGNDILDGGFVAAVAMERTYEFTGGLTVDGNFATFTIGGLTLTEGAEITDGAGQIQIAADVAAALTADIAGGDVSGMAAEGVTSVTAANGLVTFTYAPGANINTIAAVLNLNADPGTLLMSGEQLLVAGADRAENSDTFVFAETAALNGVDTINNFNTAVAGITDILDIDAFLGAAATVDTVATDFVAAGLDLTGQTAGVVYNKATLSASDIVSAFAINKITVADNGKAVVMVTADVDGVSDATANAYNVYYIEDTDVTGAQSWAVTLVGTVNTIDASGQEAGAIALALENPFA
ncbi:MAG: hypothetical protein PHF56_11255 [Desulfuromonadaceae bacterium]|nr:hypothetical protein [Desulfuromonadaceae bacterium]